MACYDQDFETLSYQTLVQFTRQCTSPFSKQDKVAVVLQNALIAALVLLTLGQLSIMIPLNASLSYSEFKFYCTQLHVAGVVTQTDFTHVCTAAADCDIQVVFLTLSDNSGEIYWLSSCKDASRCRVSSRNDTFCIITTVGTSSKSISVSHAMSVACA